MLIEHAARRLVAGRLQEPRLQQQEIFRNSLITILKDRNSMPYISPPVSSLEFPNAVNTYRDELAEQQRRRQEAERAQQSSPFGFAADLPYMDRFFHLSRVRRDVANPVSGSAAGWPHRIGRERDGTRGSPWQWAHCIAARMNSLESCSPKSTSGVSLHDKPELSIGYEHFPNGLAPEVQALDGTAT